MPQFCQKCGAENGEGAAFCGKCGSSLNRNEAGARERTPAEQATAAIEMARSKMGVVKGRTKKVWGGFTRGEKIIAVGAIAMFVSFFLPFVSAAGKSGSAFDAKAWYFYLLPISAVVSEALLYFSQGATDAKKALLARWQLIIGIFWGANVLLVMLLMLAIVDALQKSLGGFASLFGSAESMKIGFGIGAYLLLFGAFAVVFGAFKLIGRVLKEKT